MNYRINEDLKLIREMLDMSQEDIANSISVQKRTIIRIENGENYPSDNTIEKICVWHKGKNTGIWTRINGEGAK